MSELEQYIYKLLPEKKKNEKGKLDQKQGEIPSPFADWEINEFICNG